MKNVSALRRQNGLLASLSADDWATLQPHFELVPLAKREVLHEAGVALRHVHFPIVGMVSLVSRMRDGASAELAVIGHEGLVGVCAFLGDDRAHSDAVVQGAGQALRIPAAVIADLAGSSHGIVRPVLRYAQSLFVHMGQTAACNRHHGLDQQLCRWLLLNLDRMRDNKLLATQEQIAGMLGVRREGVTSGALKLQKAGLIRYVRGRISILNRKGLEQRSCECYSIVKRAYEQLPGMAA
jgi:CRP-like cAMP-binding protein